MHIIFLSFTLASLTPPLTHLITIPLSLSHSLLSSLSLALSLPLSLFAVNKRLKMTVLKTPTGHQKIIVSALFTVRECFLPF